MVAVVHKVFSEINISPFDNEISLNIAFKSVDFPEPTEPTTAIKLCLATFRFISVKIVFVILLDSVSLK